MASKEVDEFLTQFGESQRVELERIRHIIAQTVPDAQELISYGIPAFKYRGKYLVGYCAYKKHLSLFPASGPIEALKDRLAVYKVSKGTIQFTLSQTMPEDLIKELVLYRLADIEQKSVKSNGAV